MLLMLIFINGSLIEKSYNFLVTFPYLIHLKLKRKGTPFI